MTRASTASRGWSALPRRLLGLAAALLFLTAAAVAGSALWLARAAPPPQPAAAIVVLSGGMTRDNRLGDDTAARVRAGVALWQAGLAPRIHFTGASSRRFGRPDAGAQMRQLAVELGVPPAAASAETRSRSTLQNALLSRPVLGPLAGRPVILVSDGYHLARSWASFRWAGYPEVGLAAASAFGAAPRRSRPATSSARPSPGGSTSPASPPGRPAPSSADPTQCRSNSCADPAASHASSSPIFRSVFQLRNVPTPPARFGVIAAASRDVPCPCGKCTQRSPSTTASRSSPLR